LASDRQPKAKKKPGHLQNYSVSEPGVIREVSIYIV